LRAREAAENQRRAEESELLRREEQARLARQAEIERQRVAELQAQEEERQRQRAEEDERLRREEAARLAHEAEMERQRQADEQARAAAESEARQGQAVDPRDAELQRLREANARLQMEQELLKARNEAERLRLELELERTRNQAQTPPFVPAPWPVAAPPAASPPPPAALPVRAAAPVPKSKVLFEIDSDEKLKNDPGKPSKFELEEAQVITLIRTTHWNGGRGAAPGSLALRCRDGKLYGPWPATGMAHANGTANVYWLARPNLSLPATVCSVVDSDPGTWSYADDTKKRGLVRVEGYNPDTAKRPEQDDKQENPSMSPDKMNILLDLFRKKP
jgi:hypothetical protein